MNDFDRFFPNDMNDWRFRLRYRLARLQIALIDGVVRTWQRVSR